MKKKLLLGILIAGVCLYLAFRGFSVREAADTLRHAQPKWILLAVSIYFAGYLLRAVRWQILMEPIQSISARRLFAPMIIGFFANNILPLRMGEFVRAHYTGEKFQISKTASLGTILLERLCDTLAFLFTFVAVALFFPFPRWVEKGAAALGASCLLVIVGLALMIQHQDRLHRLLDSVSWIKSAWRETLLNLVRNFSHGVSGMGQLKHATGAMILSLVIWTIEGTMLYLMAHAFAVPLHYPQSFFLLFFLGLSVTLPQAPGFVGTIEFAGTLALSLLGIPRTQGLPVIIAIHATQFGFIFVLGLWAMWHEGLSFHTMVAEGRDS